MAISYSTIVQALQNAQIQAANKSYADRYICLKDGVELICNMISDEMKKDKEKPQ